ncbi:MAG: hypothetical protein IPK04_08715 [Bdellovibrionales bacterium]|nr:hypothetical protein [Bdellovibrionales bacterium]
MKKMNRVLWYRTLVVLILQTSTFAMASPDSGCSLIGVCHLPERAWSSTDAGYFGSPAAWVKLSREQETDFIEKFVSTKGDSSRRTLFNTYANKWSGESFLIEYRTLHAILVGLDSEQVKLDVLTTLFEKRILSERMSPKALLNLLSFFESDKNKFSALKMSVAASAVVAGPSEKALFLSFHDPELGAAAIRELNSVDR